MELHQSWHNMSFFIYLPNLFVPLTPSLIVLVSSENKTSYIKVLKNVYYYYLIKNNEKNWSCAHSIENQLHISKSLLQIYAQFVCIPQKTYLTPESQVFCLVQSLVKAVRNYSYRGLFKTWQNQDSIGSYSLYTFAAIIGQTVILTLIYTQKTWQPTIYYYCFIS